MPPLERFFPISPVMPIHYNLNFQNAEIFRCQTFFTRPHCASGNHYFWKSAEFSQNQFYLKCYLKMKSKFYFLFWGAQRAKDMQGLLWRCGRAALGPPLAPQFQVPSPTVPIPCVDWWTETELWATCLACRLWPWPTFYHDAVDLCVYVCLHKTSIFI